MLKFIYKKILKKLHLNSNQLSELYGRLNINEVCAGGFIDGTKMCPNTLALSIKEEKDSFIDNKQVKSLFTKYNISQFELSFLFYILFDLPSMLSTNLQDKLLNTLRKGVSELVNES